MFATYTGKEKGNLAKVIADSGVNPFFLLYEQKSISSDSD